MIADPPLLTGGVHDNETDDQVAIPVKAVGGSGIVAVVVIATSSEKGLPPNILIA
jgi:2-keto-3-deoxy-6-phosphogluconate aldolase